MAEDLHCPRCGKLFTTDTAFCRTCGLALGPVVDAVNGDAANSPIVTTRPNFKLMRFGVGLFILGLVIGLLNAAVRDLELFPQSYGKMMFLLFVAAGMLMLGAGFVFPTKKYTKRRILEPADEPERLSPAGQTFVDEIDFPRDTRELDAIHVGSVTEHTTKNLKS